MIKCIYDWKVLILKFILTKPPNGKCHVNMKTHREMSCSEWLHLRGSPLRQWLEEITESCQHLSVKQPECLSWFLRVITQLRCPHYLGDPESSPSIIQGWFACDEHCSCWLLQPSLGACKSVIEVSPHSPSYDQLKIVEYNKCGDSTDVTKKYSKMNVIVLTLRSDATVAMFRSLPVCRGNHSDNIPLYLGCVHAHPLPTESSPLFLLFTCFQIFLNFLSGCSQMESSIGSHDFSQSVSKKVLLWLSYT